MSKGSTPRPIFVSNLEYESRWDAIFGVKPKDEPIPQESEAMKHIVEQLVGDQAA